VLKKNSCIQEYELHQIKVFDLRQI